jgi:hypothetical protein
MGPPDIRTRWKCVVSFTSRPLYFLGRNRWSELDRRLGKPQNKRERIKEGWTQSTMRRISSFTKRFKDKRLNSDMRMDTQTH